MFNASDVVISRSYPILSARLFHVPTMHATCSQMEVYGPGFYFNAAHETTVPGFHCGIALSLTAPSLLPIFLRRYDWTRATGSDFCAERIIRGGGYARPLVIWFLWDSQRTECAPCLIFDVLAKSVAIIVGTEAGIHLWWILLLYSRNTVLVLRWCSHAFLIKCNKNKIKTDYSKDIYIF